MRLRPLGQALVLTGILLSTPLRAGDLRAVTERTLDAPLADVWALLTTRAGLQKWLSKDVTVEFRVGGRVETEEERLRGSGKITRLILAYDPDRMIAVRPLLIPGTVSDRSVWESSWIVVNFESLAERKTRVQVVALVPSGYPASEAVVNDLKSSNGLMLERIAGVLAGKPAGAPAR